MVLEVNVSGYKPVGCAFAVSFEFDNETILKTDVNAGLSRKRRVRMSDCRATVSGLTTLENNSTISVLYFLQEGVRRVEQDLRFVFTDEAGVMKQIQGMFLIVSAPITGDVTQFSQFDIAFEGSGGFTISDVLDESGEAALPGDVRWDWWETTEGATSISGTGNYGRTFSGQTVVTVFREGTEYDLITTGSPTGRQAKVNGAAIDFDTTLPFEADTRVYVVWQEI